MSKEVRYQEAVERNLANIKRIYVLFLSLPKKAREVISPDPRKYLGYSLDKAKHALGIRQSDNTYDKEVKSLI